MKIDLQDYSVVLGNVYETLAIFLSENKYSRYFVLVDENTRALCLPLLKDLVKEVQLIEIQSGEINKNIETCQEIWKFLIERTTPRDALVINLGGGVIGDMGGFCASTYKRGIDFIQIPTTLLAQVDASVGGKLGVDFHNFKNSVGVFANPKMVIVDPNFLKTLPVNELKSGYAELLKHALIADSDSWKKLISQKPEELSKNMDSWTEIIANSINIKKEVVELDPFEKSYRKILNFGHTIGHAIETHQMNKQTKLLLHGEAIAWGIIAETLLSIDLAGFPKEDLKQIEDYILSVYPAYNLDPSEFDAVIQLMYNDKKNRSRELNMSLLNKIGKGSVNYTASESAVREALNYINQLGN